MKNRKCYLFVFDGFSDWEPALVSAGLQQFTDFQIVTFSKNGQSVRSMGNIVIQAEASMDKVSATEVDLLLLPGGSPWEKGDNQEIKPLLDAVLEAGKTVAAICGATVFLGQHGYLDNIKHTSNHPDYLKGFAPEYKGMKNYIMRPSVADGNMITASGVSSVEFAEEIFNHFDLLQNEKLAEWFHYFKHPELALQEAN
jgi:transcriptional regulator GlxA family with amidase domain